jgi:hypothetical protein
MSKNTISEANWRLAKIDNPPTHRGHITVVTSKRPIGKKIAYDGDNLTKNRIKDDGRFIAKTVQCENLKELGNIQRLLKPTQAIINSFVPGTEHLRQFRILTESDLRKLTNTPADKPRPKALYVKESDGEMLYVGRFKECFVPSRFMIFDRDVVDGMPERLQTDKFEEWWAQMGVIDPQLLDCGYIFIPSASNRVILKSTGKQAILSLACHVYVQIADEDADSIGDYYIKMIAKAWATDFCFMKIRKNSNGQRSNHRYGIFDQCAAGVGRLIYDGPPTVGKGLRVARLKPTYRPGPNFDLSLLPLVSTAEYKKSGMRVSRENGHLVLGSNDLDLNTVIDRQSGGQVTVRDYLLGEDRHIRCQTPFRDSQSHAGFLNRTRNGIPFLHDVGTQTNHHLDPKCLLTEIENRFEEAGIDVLLETNYMTLCAALGKIDVGWLAKMKESAKQYRVAKGEFAAAYKQAEKSWTMRWSNYKNSISEMDATQSGKQTLWWDEGRAATIAKMVRRALGEKPNQTLAFNYAGAPYEVLTESITGHESKTKIRPQTSLRRLTAITIADKVESIFEVKQHLSSGETKGKSTPRELRDRLASEYPRELPPLRGIVSHPIVTAELDIVRSAGYDPNSGLYCSDDSEYKGLDDKISLVEAAASYDLLRRHLLADYPFAAPEDEAVAIAIPLTMLCRSSLDIAPGFAISSPNFGSGKTTLARTITAGILGVPASARSVPTTEEEMHKVILAELQSGTEVILFDNADANREHQSDVLAQILTSSTFEGRLLCTNDMMKVGTNTTLIMTGKNLRFRADLASRFVPCRLKPRFGQVGEPKYKHPQPEQWAVEQRSRIIFHGLRILKGYRDADMPLADLRPSRFKQWDSLVRQSVYWVQGLDICRGMHEQIESDPENDLLFEFLTAWYEIFINRLVPLRQLESVISQRSGAPEVERLLTACQAIHPKSVTRGSRRPAVNAQQLSTRLRGFLDQEVGGYILKNCPDPNRKISSSRALKHWCVVSKENDYAIGDVYVEPEDDAFE